jgi:hypothetical protein
MYDLGIRSITFNEYIEGCCHYINKNKIKKNNKNLLNKYDYIQINYNQDDNDITIEDFFNNSFSSCNYAELYDNNTWIGIETDAVDVVYCDRIYKYYNKGCRYDTHEQALEAGAYNSKLKVFNINNYSKVFEVPITPIYKKMGHF